MSESNTIGVYRIFASLQGESTRAGLPCAFVRLAGCPLRCTFCDTVEVRDARGEPLAIEAIVERVTALGHGLVEVTGGEPLAQPGTPRLLSALCDAGFELLLETSGAFGIAPVDERVRVIMDLKAPGSGMFERMQLANLDLLIQRQGELKIVVGSREDFDWSVDFLHEHRITGRVPILVSPVHGRVAPRDVAAWILRTKMPLRLQLQLHKLVWGEKGDPEQ